MPDFTKIAPVIQGQASTLRVKLTIAAALMRGAAGIGRA
jgi:hypothetical protein